MILIILGRGVLAGHASLCNGLKPLRQKQSRYAYFTDRQTQGKDIPAAMDRVRRRARICSGV